VHRSDAEVLQNASKLGRLMAAFSGERSRSVVVGREPGTVASLRVANKKNSHRS
jgi:hypothetical protein